MRVHTVDDKVFRGKSVESNNFKIKATGKAFKALSSSLYNRKIRAIVREVSTNALDGHIANGNINEPFEISVPNKLFPQFVVRDYGTGMSHEMIMEQYTTYFASTKDDSDNEVGGFGLGCKSPFSYTSSFQVKSFQNGVLRVYSCYMNANGEPSVDFQLETDTDERNGVEVTVPVREDDYQEFRDEISYVISSFDIKPDCSIEPAFEMKRINDDIFVAECRELTRVNVRMGNVVYPIRDNKKVMEALRETNFYKHNNSKIILNFDVGEVPVSMSREDLEYEPWVVDYLCKRLKEIDQKLFKEMEDYYTEIKENDDGYKLMESRYGNFGNYIERLEFVNPVPYTTKYCMPTQIGQHRKSLINSPICVLDALIDGSIKSIYDNVEGDNLDKRNFFSMLKVCNSGGNPRRFVTNKKLSKISQVDFPTDFDSMTIYVTKRSVGNAIKHDLMTKDRSFKWFYIWVHPDKLDEVKRYTNFLFGDRVNFEEAFEKGQRVTRPTQMYRTHVLDSGDYHYCRHMQDYTGCLEDAIEEAGLQDNEIIWYAYHSNGKIQIDDLNHDMVETLLENITDNHNRVKVLLIPKKFKKDVESYDGRIVHFKYYLYGMLNKFKNVPNNLVSHIGSRAISDFDDYYITRYKGNNLKKYDDNMSEDLRIFLRQRPNKKWMSKLTERYKQVMDKNDAKLTQYYDEFIEKNPILEFVRSPYSWHNDEVKRYKKAIKGMIK